MPVDYLSTRPAGDAARDTGTSRTPREPDCEHLGLDGGYPGGRVVQIVEHRGARGWEFHGLRGLGGLDGPRL